MRAILLDAHRRAPAETAARRFYQWRLTRSELAEALAGGGFVVEDVVIIGKRQGVQRLLQHNLGLTPTGLPAKAVAVMLSPLIPAVAIGHMILAIARRPG